MTAATPNESTIEPLNDASDRVAEVTAAMTVVQAPPVRAIPTRPPMSALSVTSRSVTRAAATAGYHLARLGPAGLAGIGAAVAAATLALVALVEVQHNSVDLAARIAAARRNPTIARPETELENLVATLPGRDQMPAVVGQVLKQASLAGVTLTDGHYTYSPPTGTQVARYVLEFPVKAQYPGIRDFINRTLTEIPAAALDKLSIQRKVVGDPAVTANVQFVVFVRSEAEK